MTEPAQATTPSASPAPLLPPRPWGFWATIGMTLAVGGVFFAVTVVVIITVVVGAHVVGAGGAVADPSRLAESGLILSLSYIAAAPPSLAAIVLFVWLRRSRYPMREYLGLRWPRWGNLAAWTAGLLVLIGASDALTHLSGRPVVPQVMLDLYRSSVVPPLFVLMIVVAAPVFEEFLFRGFLLEGLRHSRVGAAGAVLLTSAAWAAIHTQYDWHGILVIFLGGLVLGGARVRTGSVWLCVVLHAVNNLVATIETVLKAHFL